MKKSIHPKYYQCKVVCTSCGSEFMTGSTLKEIKVDTCSNCHPFYTGRQRFDLSKKVKTFFSFFPSMNVLKLKKVSEEHYDTEE